MNDNNTTLDPSQVPAPDPSAPDPSVQDPLAALEEVLKGSQESTKQADQVDNSVDDQAALAAAAQQQRQELTQMEAKQDEVDTQAIKEKMADLHQLTQKADQADQAATQKTADQAAAPVSDQEGFEIHQLGHDKIAGES